jgi:hypothetical protein
MAQIRQKEILKIVVMDPYDPKFLLLKVWLVAWCHFFYLIFSSPSHSYHTVIRRLSPRFLSILSSLASSVGKTSLGCRAENRTLACHTASRRTTIWASRTLLSYAAPFWTTPHPSELRRTLLSNAAPFWAKPHPNWATPYPSELRRTLLSYAVPLLSYAAPYLSYDRQDMMNVKGSFMNLERFLSCLTNV